MMVMCLLNVQEVSASGSEARGARERERERERESDIEGSKASVHVKALPTNDWFERD